jgi:hypothetical protein
MIIDLLTILISEESAAKLLWRLDGLECSLPYISTIDVRPVTECLTIKSELSLLIHV